MGRVKSLSSKQAEHQDRREIFSGRYRKGYTCYGCGKSAGVDYFSHSLTDTGDWGDLALILCRKCAKATSKMTDPKEFIAYQKKHGGRHAVD
jgi:hypothetical protein